MTTTTLHTCTPDQWNTCNDETRDWCNTENACTVWAGEFCTTCGAEWGVSN